MTSSDPQWMQPTHQIPAPRPNRKRPVPLIVGSVLAVLLLCCGGAGVIGKVFGGKDGQKTALTSPISYPSSSAPATTRPAPRSTTTHPTAKPTTVPPTTHPTVAPTTVKPKPAPTTHRPVPIQPKPKPKPKPTTAPPSRVVHPGAFCSPPGATGVTTKGTPMSCQLAKDGRYRWKSI